MTPQERQLIDELFDRLASLENTPRDPDAEAHDPRGLAPGAERRLFAGADRAGAGRGAQSRQQPHPGVRAAVRRPAAEEQPRGFLDTMRDTVFGRDEPRGSVPRVPPGGAPAGGPTRGAGRPMRRAGVPAAAGYPPGYSRRADAATGWRRWRLVSRHCGGGRGRRDRRLAADGRHPLRDGGPPGCVGPASKAFEDSGGRGEVAHAGAASGGSDLARQAGLNDIGRPARRWRRAGLSPRQRTGLLDSNRGSKAVTISDFDDSGDDGDCGDGGDTRYEIVRSAPRQQNKKAAAICGGLCIPAGARQITTTFVPTFTRP